MPHRLPACVLGRRILVAPERHSRGRCLCTFPTRWFSTQIQQQTFYHDFRGMSDPGAPRGALKVERERCGVFSFCLGQCAAISLAGTAPTHSLSSPVHTCRPDVLLSLLLFSYQQPNVRRAFTEMEGVYESIQEHKGGVRLGQPASILFLITGQPDVTPRKV